MKFKIKINDVQVAAVANGDMVQCLLEIFPKPGQKVSVTAPSGCTAECAKWPVGFYDSGQEARRIADRARLYEQTVGACESIS